MMSCLKRLRNMNLVEEGLENSIETVKKHLSYFTQYRIHGGRKFKERFLDSCEVLKYKIQNRKMGGLAVRLVAVFKVVVLVLI